MNVFVDFHHTALLRSLIMLFEGRLGGNVYRPIGLEWHTEGFWKVYDHPATALQFLSLDQGYRPEDGTPPLNQFIDIQKFTEFGTYYCADPENETYNKAITLEEFKRRKFDIVIATLPQHIEPFKRLIAQYQPEAKLILQVGNNWDWQNMDIKNVLASTQPKQYPGNMNVVFYHQEFDLSLFFPSEEPMPEKNIYSFVNLFHENADYPLFKKFEGTMQGWNFKAYGGQCPDGVVNGVKNLSEKMRQARFIWHTKPGGDGFGHVIHNAFAVARPIIVRKSHYFGQLAEQLLTDCETCIDLDVHPFSEAYVLIDKYSLRDNWLEMSRNMRRRFEKVVDYDLEEIKIREFIENLQ